MAIYVVMEPPGANEEDAAERAVIVRDGFSLIAFILPLVWLLWHRLWIEGIVAFVASVVLMALGETTGFALAGAGLSLLVSLFVALEGPALRIAALRRRGWREWGAVEGDSAADAEIRYLAGEDEEPDAGPWSTGPAYRPPPSPAHVGPALGLLGYPGRS
ncbi:MAG: DUF2628 domain-containing protein [Mesorhizobium sp.]|nr:DUF2628 domain-containing protein [Mesorhizobium sp.]MBL8579797.1 DUF2628 domain-containing protein [Mesorhizobium sp.]